MERMSGMTMHAEHVLTRALVANACAWTIGCSPSAFATAKAYGARRPGSPST